MSWFMATPPQSQVTGDKLVHLSSRAVNVNKNRLGYYFNAVFDKLMDLLQIYCWVGIK